jgi:hypothetical protein
LDGTFHRKLDKVSVFQFKMKKGTNEAEILSTNFTRTPSLFNTVPDRAPKEKTFTDKEHRTYDLPKLASQAKSSRQRDDKERRGVAALGIARREPLTTFLC